MSAIHAVGPATWDDMNTHELDPNRQRHPRTKGLTRCFGDLVAVDGVSLEVPREGIAGMVGPNPGYTAPRPLGKTTHDFDAPVSQWHP